MTPLRILTVSFILTIYLSLTSCINIAPDEQWDNDDTRIWIQYASSLNLGEQWFKENKKSLDLTVLTFEEKYEDSIKVQIIESPHFNETIDPDSTLWQKINREKLMGFWHTTNNGYKFLQAAGNQYPMTIEIDTVKNQVIIISKK